MKKTLIALAVMAASGASMAQVTLYGVVDVAVGASSSAGGSPAIANDKFQALTSGNSNMNNGNSRYGLRGTEDLGQGLKASFNFEGSLDIADGANRGSGGQLFSRAANVSVDGGFGSVKIGRQLTATFLSAATWELTGAANYSAYFNQFGFGSPAGPRDNAEVVYTSPKLGGAFTIAAGTTLEGNGIYKDAAGNAKSKYELTGTYAAGPIAASLAYTTADKVYEATVLGGQYNFGMFAAAASWTNAKDGAGKVTKEGFSVGAMMPMGAWTFSGDIAQVTGSDFKLDGDTNFTLEAKYALSKRTFVYGVYMRDGKSNVATSKDIDAYSIGLRHNF